MWEQPLPKKKSEKKKKNKHSIEDSQPSGILNKTQIPQMKTKEHKTWKGQRKKELAENTSVTSVIISSKPTVWWVWTLAYSMPDSGLINATMNLCGRDMDADCGGNSNTVSPAQGSTSPPPSNPKP